MKHDAIVDQGIPIHERVPIPDEMIPADSRVEIDAKIQAGYFTTGTVMSMEELAKVKGRGWEDIDVRILLSTPDGRTKLTMSVALNGPCNLARELQGGEDASSDRSARQLSAVIHSDLLRWMRTHLSCATRRRTNPPITYMNNAACDSKSQSSSRHFETDYYSADYVIFPY